MAALKYILQPNGNKDLFYSGSDSETRCIGHLRMDFGSGKEFWTSWHPHAAGEHNNAAFSGELQSLVSQLRKTLLRNRARMYKYLAEYPAAVLEDGSLRYYGYCVRTARYAFYIRCTPELGNYSYIYCYLREVGNTNVDLHEHGD